MLRKALSLTVLATVLLTSSISANELTAPNVGSTAKVETISAFDAIPQSAQSELNMIELNQQGEGAIWDWICKHICPSPFPEDHPEGPDQPSIF